MRARQINEFKRGQGVKTSLGLGSERHVRDAKLYLGSDGVYYLDLPAHETRAQLIFATVEDGRTKFIENPWDAEEVSMNMKYLDREPPQDARDAIFNWVLKNLERLLNDMVINAYPKEYDI